MPHYDAVVLGAGGVGTAAALHLARRGAKTLAVDRFGPAHALGSSHGQTRIIRQAYFEHADYVPLLRRTFILWRELEEEYGRPLYHEVGLVEIGPADGIVIRGVRQAAARHGLPLEELGPADVERRWPALRVPADLAAVFESRAGYLLVEECVRAHAEAATRAGAEFLWETPVVGWTESPRGVELQTAAGNITGDRLVVAAGAWAGPLLKELQVPLEVRRKVLLWYPTDEAPDGAHESLPAFFYELPAGYFYGFPRIDPRGVKVAEHSGGPVVADPLGLDRHLRETDRAPVEQFLTAHLPGVGRRVADHAVCMYTVTPDEHFLVGLLPGDGAPIAVAAGLSGHGFKFAPVLGEILADLALAGRTGHPIGFLNPTRFG